MEKQAMTKVQKLPVPQAVDIQTDGDPHSDNLQSAARYVQGLRDEVATMHARNMDLERDNNMLYSEVQCLKLQLEAERTERRHYHQYATSVTTSFDVVVRVIEDALARAVQHARAPDDGKGAPEIKMPDNLQKWLSRGQIDEPESAQQAAE